MAGRNHIYVWDEGEEYANKLTANDEHEDPKMAKKMATIKGNFDYGDIGVEETKEHHSAF